MLPEKDRQIVVDNALIMLKKSRRNTLVIRYNAIGLAPEYADAKDIHWVWMGVKDTKDWDIRMGASQFRCKRKT